MATLALPLLGAFLMAVLAVAITYERLLLRGLSVADAPAPLLSALLAWGAILAGMPGGRLALSPIVRSPCRFAILLLALVLSLLEALFAALAAGLARVRIGLPR